MLLNWQSVEGYPLREHLDEAVRFLGRAISRRGDQPQRRKTR
jgi:hypothetical protein